jgi:hypothetical protein
MPLLLLLQQQIASDRCNPNRLRPPRELLVLYRFNGTMQLRCKQRVFSAGVSANNVLVIFSLHSFDVNGAASTLLCMPRTLMPRTLANRHGMIAFDGNKNANAVLAKV